MCVLLPPTKKHILEAVRLLGLAAKHEIQRITGRVNTHKGVIFSLGICGNWMKYILHGQKDKRLIWKGFPSARLLKSILKAFRPTVHLYTPSPLLCERPHAFIRLKWRSEHKRGCIIALQCLTITYILRIVDKITKSAFAHIL